MLQVNLGRYTASPLAFAALVGAERLVLVSAGGCNVTLLPRALATGPAPSPLPAPGSGAAQWLPCAGGGPPLALPPSLTDEGDLLIAAAGALVHAVRAAGADAGAVAWAASLPWAPATPALHFYGQAVLASASGALALLGTRGGGGGGGAPAPHLPPLPALPCAPGDAFSQAPTLLPTAGGSAADGAIAAFALLSDAGCASGFSFNGTRLWGPTPPPPPGSGTLTGPAVAFFVPLQRLLFPLSAGRVCCLQLNSSAAPGACSGWPSGSCATLSPAPLPQWERRNQQQHLQQPQQQQQQQQQPLAAAAAAAAAAYSGLAASPTTLDFHGGQAYLADSGGVLWVVNAGSGAVGASFNASLPWAAPCSGSGRAPCAPAPPLTPLLVSSVGGKAHRNAIVVAVEGLGEGQCSTASGAAARGRAGAGAGAGSFTCVLALQVGDGGSAARDDDDSLVSATDDDGGAEGGVLWAADFPEAQARQAHPRGAALRAFAPASPALSVTPSGSLLVPTLGGLYAVRGAGAPGGAGVSYGLLNGLVLGVVALGVVALVGVMLCVARRRRLRALEAAAGSGEEEEEEGEGGGEGGRGQPLLAAAALGAGGALDWQEAGAGASPVRVALSLQQQQRQQQQRADEGAAGPGFSTPKAQVRQSPW